MVSSFNYINLKLSGKSFRFVLNNKYRTETTTGELVEYTKASEIIILKELGKLPS